MVDSLRVYLSQDKNPGHLRSNKVLSTKQRCRLHIRTEDTTVWALSRDSLPTSLKSAACQLLGGKGTRLKIAVYQGFNLLVGFPGDASGKESAVSSLGGKNSLEEGMATHSSILAERIP